MANSTHTSRAHIVHLRHQHRELDRLALDAEQFLRMHTSRSGRQGGGELATTIDRISALRDQLKRHCDQESAGGCLEEIVCGRPELNQAATRLEQDTRSLISELTDLVQSARSGRISLAQTKERFGELADQLRQHQLEENRLLSEAYGLELVNGQIME